MVFVCHVTLHDHVIKALSLKPLKISHQPIQLAGHGHSTMECKWRHNSFSLSRDLAKPHDQRVM